PHAGGPDQARRQGTHGDRSGTRAPRGGGIVSQPKVRRIPPRNRKPQRRSRLGPSEPIGPTRSIATTGNGWSLEDAVMQAIRAFHAAGYDGEAVIDVHTVELRRPNTLGRPERPDLDRSADDYQQVWHYISVRPLSPSDWEEVSP